MSTLPSWLLAWFCSPWPPVHQGLAAAVTAPSTRLTSVLSIPAILGTPAGQQLAKDLQRIYCEGSVLARYCSSDAIAHQPSAVVSFLRGFGKLTCGPPQLGVTADCVTLERAAGFIDLALTEASQPQVAVAGEPTAQEVVWRLLDIMLLSDVVLYGR